MSVDGAQSRAMDESSGESAGDVTRREKGAIIHNRWVAAGIKSLNEMAAKSGFDRGQLAKAEKGEASDAYYERVMAWLDRYTGEPVPPSGHVVTFEAEGLFGVARVAVQGPVEDADELQARFERLLTNLLRRQGESSVD